MSVKLPLASSALAGINSTGTQTIAGAKTFNDVMTFKASAGTTTVGSYNTNGQWAVGPTSSLNYSGTRVHTITGAIQAGGTSAAGSAQFMFISGNAYNSAFSGSITRQTGFSGGAIGLDQSSNNTTVDVIQFYVNLAADSATTDAIRAGGVNATGAWSIGAGGGSAAHVINGLTTVQTSVANFGGIQAKYTNNQSIAMRCNTEGAQIAGCTNLDNTSFITGDGAGRIILQGAGTTGLQFETSPSTTTGNARTWTQYGSLSNAGAWTLGSFSSSTDHIIQSADNVPLILKSSSTTCHLQMMYSTSSVGGYIRTASGIPLNFLDQASTSMGNAASGGFWTLGPAASASTSQNYLIAQGPSGSGVGPTIQIINNYTGTATNSDGNYSIQCTKPSTTTTSAQNFIRFTINAGGTNSGKIAANGADAAAFAAVSDSRLKQNVVSISGSLAKIMQTRPVEFEYIALPGQTQKGFIAQEFEEVFASDVAEDEDGMKSIVGWSPQLTILVQALQELKAQHDALQTSYDDYVAAHP